MPRSGRLRTYIKEFRESPRFDKLSFIPPFLVLIVEIILLEHAIRMQVFYVIELTLILLILSIIEILFVSEEIHKHYIKGNFDRILTIRLDDFIIENKNKNVKMLVEDFIKTNPKYEEYRNEVYHIACQILVTHKEEALEKDIFKKLESFMKRKKKENVDDIVKSFIDKYPKYKKYRGEIYQKACQIKPLIDNKKKL